MLRQLTNNENELLPQVNPMQPSKAPAPQAADDEWTDVSEDALVKMQSQTQSSQDKSLLVDDEWADVNDEMAKQMQAVQPKDDPNSWSRLAMLGVTSAAEGAKAIEDLAKMPFNALTSGIIRLVDKGYELATGQRAPIFDVMDKGAEKYANSPGAKKALEELGYVKKGYFEPMTSAEGFVSRAGQILPNVAVMSLVGLPLTMRQGLGQVLGGAMGGELMKARGYGELGQAMGEFGGSVAAGAPVSTILKDWGSFATKYYEELRNVLGKGIYKVKPEITAEFLANQYDKVSNAFNLEKSTADILKENLKSISDKMARNVPWNLEDVIESAQKFGQLSRKFASKADDSGRMAAKYVALEMKKLASSVMEKNPKLLPFANHLELADAFYGAAKQDKMNAFIERVGKELNKLPFSNLIGKTAKGFMQGADKMTGLSAPVYGAARGFTQGALEGTLGRALDIDTILRSPAMRREYAKMLTAIGKDSPPAFLSATKNYLTLAESEKKKK